MTGFRGEDPKYILKLIREVENTSKVIPSGEKLEHPKLKPVSFFNETWLRIGKVNHVRLSLQALKSVLRALLKGRIRTAASKIFSARKIIAATDVAATWVRVKNNILVLYPDKGWVCKIRRPNSIRDAKSLNNEYLVLNKVAEFKGLQAPEPISYQTEPVPALWLRYINGQSVNAKMTSSVALKIAEALLSWYDHCGVQKITASAYPPLVEVLEGGENWLQEKGWTEPEAMLIYSVLKSASEQQLLFLQSQIHGDASVGNAMIDINGKLVITDWENSRVDVVAHDITKLVLTAPKVRHLYSQWQEKHLDAKLTNLTLELAVINILRGLNLKKMQQYFTEVTFYNDEQTLLHINSIRHSVLSTCREAFEKI